MNISDIRAGSGTCKIHHFFPWPWHPTESFATFRHSLRAKTTPQYRGTIPRNISEAQLQRISIEKVRTKLRFQFFLAGHGITYERLSKKNLVTVCFGA